MRSSSSRCFVLTFCLGFLFASLAGAAMVRPVKRGAAEEKKAARTVSPAEKSVPQEAAVKVPAAQGGKPKKVKYVKSKYGLGALMEFGKSMDETKKELAQETQNYANAKKAVGSGGLKQGDPADRVKRDIGEPVIVLYDSAAKRYEWIYKPANASYFSKEKLYLFFDENGKYVDHKIPQ